MGIIKSSSERIHENARKNQVLQAKMFEAEAKLEYVAMMTDVDLPEEQEEGEQTDE